MKKMVMALALIIMGGIASNISATSSGEWEKWQITVQGSTTKSGAFTVTELCKIKDYFSGHSSQLNNYIADLKKLNKTGNNSNQIKLLGDLQSFYAGLGKKDRDKFKTNIVIPAIRNLNPKAYCL